MKKLTAFITFVLLMAVGKAHADHIKPFSSDGCSGAPDTLGTSFIHCCIAHDFNYWLGGTEEQKEQADETLKQCIQQTIPNYKFVGTIYKLGVIIGGTPRILGSVNNPFTWRWGYGHEQNNGFAPLSKVELTSALAELQKMESNLNEQERALNETGGYAWRFWNLNISSEQFKQIRADLQKKMNEITSALNEMP
ncbi:MAG: hypothetical protein ACXWRZ_15870 [Bdellovibrio sp.]